MASLGFARRAGRHFEHPRTRYYVEFPSGPLGIGNTPAELLSSPSLAARRAQRPTLEQYPGDCLFLGQH
jgi:hypothetical protein